MATKKEYQQLDKDILYQIGNGISKRRELFDVLKPNLEEVCKVTHFVDPMVLLDRRLYELKRVKKIRHPRIKNCKRNRTESSYGWYINGVNYL